MSTQRPHSVFLTGAIPSLYLNTAGPIIVLMMMSGFLNVTDAWFLGVYAGEQALAAVTVSFPLFMLLSALGMLVASGMSSLLARALGRGDQSEAESIFASTHALSLSIAGGLIVLFLLAGGPVLTRLSLGDAALAAEAARYIGVLVWGAPVALILSVQADGLRNEGHAGFMALAGLGVTLANIAFNAVLIIGFDMGAAGAAIGTVMAQACSMAVILVWRMRHAGLMSPPVSAWLKTRRDWVQILVLGAPSALGLFGVALGSLTVLSVLQLSDVEDYQASVAAYGVATRVVTFAILPVIGLSQAVQTITGINHGAGQTRRVRDSLRFALLAALCYGALVEASVQVFADQIGGWFVSGDGLAPQIAFILRRLMALFVLIAPLSLLSLYFQAQGDALRAAVLGLAKPYALFIPLVVVLGLAFGPNAIWWASPIADLGVLALSVFMLATAGSPMEARSSTLSADAGGSDDVRDTSGEP
ncbi:MATE family efflux transporter [Oceanicaulis sp.]|uniref:MATE family efflux transporter n=1 Tax=Oceanicaulis sp. TaxID=1924941 RepID=UPI003F6F3044